MGIYTYSEVVHQRGIYYRGISQGDIYAISEVKKKNVLFGEECRLDI